MTLRAWVHGLASMVAALVGLPGLGCSSTPSLLYRAEAIDGRVVDDDTKKPIEGVIVVAEWELVDGLMDPVPVGDLEILETVTNAEGSYHFDGWGPKEVKSARFHGNDPRLIFFKGGYEFKSLRNSLHPPGAGSPMYDESGQPRSVWSGRTIDLRPEPPSYAVSDQAFETLYSPFKGCMWKKMPRLLAMLVTTTGIAHDGGPKARSLLLQIMNGRSQAQCGQVEEQIRNYL